jgi:hypothetical protein
MDSELKLLMDNVKPFVADNFKSMIKNDIVSIEELQVIREPVIRNLRMHSALEKYERLTSSV